MINILLKKHSFSCMEKKIKNHSMFVFFIFQQTGMCRKTKNMVFKGSEAIADERRFPDNIGTMVRVSDLTDIKAIAPPYPE